MEVRVVGFEMFKDLYKNDDFGLILKEVIKVFQEVIFYRTDSFLTKPDYAFQKVP